MRCTAQARRTWAGVLLTRLAMRVMTGSSSNFGHTMTQCRERLHHDSITLAIVEQLQLREIGMGLDLKNSRLFPCGFDTSLSCLRLTFDNPMALHRRSSTKLSKAFHVSVRVTESS